jgi:hypothetical protein
MAKQEVVHVVNADLSFVDGIKYCLVRGWDFQNGDMNRMQALSMIRWIESGRTLEDMIEVPHSSKPMRWQDAWREFEFAYGSACPPLEPVDYEKVDEREELKKRQKFNPQIRFNPQQTARK